jgi:hypothetical protein
MGDFFHFDRYQCTFPGVPMEDICRSLHFIAAPLETYPRVKGYRRAISFGDLAFLMHEPTAGTYGCHLLVGGGDTCQPIVDEVRKLLPDHKVSRVDVAVDYDYPGSFKDLEGIALAVALNHKPRPLKTPVAGDHYQENCRTSYFGSRTSTHFARVYEKGHEQRALGLNPNASLNWSRFEIEVKPTKKGDARKQAASLSPDQLAHSSAWTSQIAVALGSTCGQGVRMTTKRMVSEFQSMLFHLAKQYGPPIRRAIGDGETTPQAMQEFFYRHIILGQKINKTTATDAEWVQ